MEQFPHHLLLVGEGFLQALLGLDTVEKAVAMEDIEEHLPIKKKSFQMPMSLLVL